MPTAREAWNHALEKWGFSSLSHSVLALCWNFLYNGACCQGGEKWPPPTANPCVRRRIEPERNLLLEPMRAQNFIARGNGPVGPSEHMLHRYLYKKMCIRDRACVVSGGKKPEGQMCAGASQVQKQVKPLAMGKGRGGKENDPLAGCDGQGLPQLGGVLRTGEEYAGVNAVGNDRNGDSRQSRGCRRPPGDPAGAAHNSQPVPPLSLIHIYPEWRSAFPRRDSRFR